MSYKISFIFSMIFVVMFFLFGVDLINIQFIYTNLDQTAISIGYLIAKEGNLNNISSLEQTYNVVIDCLNSETPKFGDVVEFKVKQSFKPLIISKDDIFVTVSRTTVIGFYD